MKMRNRNEKWKGLERWGLIKGFLVQAPGCMNEEDELQSSGWLSQGHTAGHGRPGSPPSVPLLLLWEPHLPGPHPSTAPKDLYDAMSPVPYAMCGGSVITRL